MTDRHQVEIAGELRGETPRGFRFFDGDREVFLPKSLVVWDGDAEVMTMPEWLAIDRRLV